MRTERRLRAGGDPSTRGIQAGDRVLIVDDESAIRLIFRVNLRAAGYETLEAADGARAVEIARTERPDLIVLDVMLPELSGWAVAERLAGGEAETADIPILFVSARAEPRDERRAYDLGGVGYLRKPFDPAVLSEQVRTVLERIERGERDALRAEWRAALDAQ